MDLITFTEVILTEVMPLRPLLLMPLFSNKNCDIELETTTKTTTEGREIEIY